MNIHYSWKMLHGRSFLGSLLIWGFGALVLACLAIAIYMANRIIPYSLQHFRQIYAIQLASRVNAWRASGGTVSDIRALEITNSHTRIFALRTNVTFKGINHESFVALEHENLRDKGILVATTNLDIFWIGRRGHVELQFRKD